MTSVQNRPVSTFMLGVLLPSAWTPKRESTGSGWLPMPNGAAVQWARAHLRGQRGHQGYTSHQEREAALSACDCDEATPCMWASRERVPHCPRRSGRRHEHDKGPRYRIARPGAGAGAPPAPTRGPGTVLSPTAASTQSPPTVPAESGRRFACDSPHCHPWMMMDHLC